MAMDSLASCYDLGKTKPSASEESLIYLRDAAGFQGDKPAAYYLFARAARITGHPEEAKAAMEKVAALHADALDTARLQTDQNGLGTVEQLFDL